MKVLPGSFIVASLAGGIVLTLFTSVGALYLHQHVLAHDVHEGWISHGNDMVRMTRICSLGVEEVDFEFQSKDDPEATFPRDDEKGPRSATDASLSADQLWPAPAPLAPGTVIPAWIFDN